MTGKDLLARMNGRDTRPMTLRRPETEHDYAMAKQLDLLRPLHEEPTLEEFDHWRIIDNRFPYDAAFETCHLLLPKRVVPDRLSLEAEEVIELDEILYGYVPDRYDVILENTLKRRSIASHWHLHLLKYYATRGEASA